MTVNSLCNAYLTALNTADLTAVQSMFTPDAVVLSPLYGTRKASEFYADLFADTTQSKTTLINVFDTSENSASIALHFHYQWTLNGGKIVTFECVDVFELSDDKTQFKKLTIIYDTAPLRSDFDVSKAR
ncbi:nuclear transport factor 2 family protein [Epibacterium ulvae]|uniref:nuclear transport factor 2 family protein n=1 Tax=Epibacterium ulvae TaxID=1156985 RepID=UPI002493942A|nr:nuclear transport factor 2 family protein [Epibacterium ulvae]